MLQFSYNRLIRARSLLPHSLPLLLLLLLGGPPVYSQSETQHVINLPWRLSSGAELTLHGRIRTRPTSQGLYQGRAGALLGLRVKPKVTAIAGYYSSHEEEVLDWEGWNRVFGGAEHRFGTWKGTWKARHLAEWFDAPHGEFYYRVRHRVGWESTARLAPYSNVEIFWDRNAWRSVRYQAGIRYRIKPGVSWDFHYFHEPRRQDVGWWPRNMWGTTLEVRIKGYEQSSPKRAATRARTP